MTVGRAPLYMLLAASSCSGGSIVTERQDADAASDASVLDGGADSSDVPLADAAVCPTERPFDSSACPTLGLVCIKKCTASDRRAWTAECILSLDRLAWVVWGNPCSDSEW